MAKTQVWQSVIGNLFKICLGAAGIRPLGLLVGYIFTQTGGILSLSKNFYRTLKANLRNVSKKRMIFFLKRYAGYPRYRLPSQFLLAFVNKMPLLFFAWHFDAEIAKIGRNNPKAIYEVTKNISHKLFFLSLLPFLLLLILGPWLFALVFGEIWREAGLYVRILALNILTMFFSNPITHALNIFERQNYYLQINTIRLLLILTIFSTTYILNLTPVITLLLYSLVLSIHRIFVYFRIVNFIKNKS